MEKPIGKYPLQCLLLPFPAGFIFSRKRDPKEMQIIDL